MNDPVAPHSEPPNPHWLNLGRLFRLARKELRECLRDRRTVVTLILMPTLLYPLLSVAFRAFFFEHLAQREVPIYVIGFEHQSDWDFLRALLGDKISGVTRAKDPQNNDPETTGSLPSSASDPPGSLHSSEAKPRIQMEFLWPEGNEKLDLEAALIDRIDLGFRIVKTYPGPPQVANYDVELIIRKGSQASLASLRWLEDQLAESNDQMIGRLLNQIGLAQRPNPVSATVLQKEIDGFGAGAVSLAAIIPMILILMTITGAVYPAIDLTAGERERGTMETLVSAPVPRISLLMAKYLAVFVVALLTASINLLAMSGTIWLTGLSGQLFGDEGVRLSSIVLVFLLMMLFVAFFSAVLLAITSFARSFKEAQAYLIPLIMFSIAPGLVALTPGIKLEGLLPIVPMLNVVVLTRDLLEGTAEWPTLLIVVCSTLAYSSLGLATAARLFGSDAVLYGTQGAWSDLFKRNKHSRTIPQIGEVILCLAFLFLAQFVFVHLLAQTRFNSNLQSFLRAAATCLIFVGIPSLFTFQQRLDWPQTYSFRLPRWSAWIAGLVLGLSLWPLVAKLTLMLDEGKIVEISAEQMEQISQLVERFRVETSPFLIYLSFALAPAFCEEFFFRGYLLSALRGNKTGWKNELIAILSCGLIFGAFHQISAGGITEERLIPTSLLGIVLAALCVRTGSIYPGIVLHLAHNGFFAYLTINKELAEQYLGNDLQQIPTSWLWISAITSLAGFTIAWFSPRTKAIVRS